jgi:hypothetical protein
MDRMIPHLHMGRCIDIRRHAYEFEVCVCANGYGMLLPLGSGSGGGGKRELPPGLSCWATPLPPVGARGGATPGRLWG